MHKILTALSRTKKELNPLIQDAKQGAEWHVKHPRGEYLLQYIEFSMSTARQLLSDVKNEIQNLENEDNSLESSLDSDSKVEDANSQDIFDATFRCSNSL